MKDKDIKIEDMLNKLRTEAKNSKGICKESFEKMLELLTDNRKLTTEKYESFFSEIVKDSEQYVDFEKTGDDEIEKNRWLESSIAAFYQVYRKYGTEMVSKICDIFEDITCLYPYEFEPVAEYLKNGEEPEKITDCISKGKFDNKKGEFPKLSNLDESPKNIPKTFTISSFNDEKYEIKPHLYLVEVYDYMHEKQHNLGLNFTYKEDGMDMPFGNFTLNFCEFIGMKNCAYIDTNNCWYADEILQTGIAEDTGLTKLSGFCKYPLWQFKEEFLKTVDGDIYQKYSDEYDEYMRAAMLESENDEEPTMGM